MDIRKVKKLIELLEESGIAEIEIKEGEESVRISRNSGVNMQAPMMHYASAPMQMAAAALASAPATTGSVAASARLTAKNHSTRARPGSRVRVNVRPGIVTISARASVHDRVT